MDIHQSFSSLFHPILQLINAPTQCLRRDTVLLESEENSTVKSFFRYRLYK